MYQYLRIIYTRHIKSYSSCNLLPVIPVLYVLHSFVLIVDIICIDPITSYLVCNFRPILQIYSFSVNACCITSFPVFNLICFMFSLHFFLVCCVIQYKLNHVIRILCICPHFSYSSQFNFDRGCYLYWSHYELPSLKCPSYLSNLLI